MKLSELIDQVREELQLARQPKEGALLSLEECELEIAVDVEAAVGGELSIKILGTGGTIGSDANRTSGHRIRVKFSALPSKTFEEAVAEIKEMLEILRKANVPESAATAVLGKYADWSTSHQYLRTTLPSIPGIDGIV